jgi:DNA-binding LacI/PurR family transcriptional regulator
VDISRMVYPSLTTISQPVQEMAEKAITMILNTKDKVGTPRKVLLKPRLVARDSTARPGERMRGPDNG